MFRVIDAHRFRDARLVFVARLDFPAFLQFAQRQTIRRVAIDFVGGSKNEWRFGRKLSSGFEQIQRAVGVYGEIGLRLASGPVVWRARGGMQERLDPAGILFAATPPRMRRQRNDSVRVISR